jgi:Mrp family chromosome partitioning ATPase
VKERSPLERSPLNGRAPNLHGLLASIDATPKMHDGGKIVLFSSARPGEGKTTVIAELVNHIIARQRQTVAVIDAGPRRDLSRRLASYGIHDFAQVTSAIALQTEAFTAQPLGQPGKAAVLKLGADTLNSESNILGAETVQRLSARFDYVFIEMPSFADAPIAVSSAHHLDGVIMVIEAGRTRWPAIQHAREQFERSGATVIGAFLNKRTYFIPQKIYEWL